MKRTALCLGFAAAFASAQNADPHPEIRGAITEAGTHFGISGLQVLLTTDGQPSSSASTTTTDSQGAFRFQPDDFGHYKVEVKMDGYRIVTDFSNLDRNYSNPAVVVITRGNPSEDVRFTLARSAEIRGRVVDEETGQPVAKFSVAAVGLAYSRGRRVFGAQLPIPPAITDDDGRFVLIGLMPGNYVVETLPRVLGGDRVLTTFSETDLTTIDQDFERTYWPGGRDLDSAAPIAILGGQSLNAGTIKVRKVPYYRVRAVFPAGNCIAADKVLMQFRPATLGGEAVTANVPCGMDFLIRNVEPGSYRLTLATQRTPATRTQAAASVDVTDRNREVAISLASGVDLDGRVIFPEGVPQSSFERLMVSVQSTETGLAGGGPLTPDAQGGFRVVNVSWGRLTVGLLNLTSGYYVREIRYNGNPISGISINVTPDVPPRSLEIVIDDKPAAVRGVVAKDDQPLNKPYVVLAKSPFTLDNLSQENFKVSTGDERGNFQFASLAPGEYRILAVPGDTKDKLDEPGVLERLFAGAMKITLDRGNYQNVQVKPADPLH